MGSLITILCTWFTNPTPKLAIKNYENKWDIEIYDSLPKLFNNVQNSKQLAENLNKICDNFINRLSQMTSVANNLWHAGQIADDIVKTYIEVVMVYFLTESEVLGKFEEGVKIFNQCSARFFQQAMEVDIMSYCVKSINREGFIFANFTTDIGFWDYFKQIIVDNKITQIVDLNGGRGLYSRMMELFLLAHRIPIKIIMIDEKPCPAGIKPFFKMSGGFELYQKLIDKNTLLLIFWPWNEPVKELDYFTNHGSGHLLYSGENSFATTGGERFGEILNTQWSEKKIFKQLKACSIPSVIKHYVFE